MLLSWYCLTKADVQWACRNLPVFIGNYSGINSVSWITPRLTFTCNLINIMGSFIERMNLFEHIISHTAHIHVNQEHLKFMREDPL